ncbi:hypothetical protein DIPPA_18538 [Diplonema papillatum]|nr:hypothetical protein DIPPA_18538 [Diplonema papillatum]|eukprot:gene12306-19024_t
MVVLEEVQWCRRVPARKSQHEACFALLGSIQSDDELETVDMASKPSARAGLAQPAHSRMDTTIEPGGTPHFSCTDPIEEFVSSPTSSITSPRWRLDMVQDYTLSLPSCD